MFSDTTFLPPTSKKVNMNTPPYINEEIMREIDESVNLYRTKSSLEIKERLKELDHEWDTERVLEMNFASLALWSSLLGLLGSKKWLFLSGVASVFMMQHALKGWCPPLSVIRRFKIRTAWEINQEREKLKKLIQ